MKVTELNAHVARAEGAAKHLRPAREFLGDLREFQNRGRRGAIPWGIQFLTDCLGHLYVTDLGVIIADTGAGKTTATRLVVDQALAAGKRVAWFMLEAHDGEGQQRQVYDIVRDLAFRRGVPGSEAMTFGRWANGMCSPDVHELDGEAVHEVHERVEHLLMRYRGKRFTAGNIASEFKAIHTEVDLIVFDHLHYVDDSDDQTETRALTEVAKTLRNVALEIQRPVLAVAHVRKRGIGKAASAMLPSVEDIHGSSNVPKITTRVVSIARAYDRGGITKNAEGDPIAPTYMQVAKDRWDGTRNIAGLLRFNLATGRYEDAYLLGRFDIAGRKFTEFTRDEVPRWCSCPDEHALPTFDEEEMP